MSIFENKSMYETFKYAQSMYETSQFEYGYEYLNYLKTGSDTVTLARYASEAQLNSVTVSSIGLMIDDMEKLEYPVAITTSAVLCMLKRQAREDFEAEQHYLSALKDYDFYNYYEEDYEEDY